jgi:Tol biopolymer transport system component
MNPGNRRVLRRLYSRMFILCLGVFISDAFSAGAFPPGAAAHAAPRSEAPSRTVFGSDRYGGSAEVLIMEPDGSGVTRLTENTTDEFMPALSPDGRTVVYESRRGGVINLYLNAATGQDERALTTNGGAFPAWSPDGAWIYYGRQISGRWCICRIRADGTGYAQLTANAADDLLPNCSPDGARVLFISSRDGRYEIYRMDADGANQTRLTDTPGDKMTPRWSPDGAGVLYTLTVAGTPGAAIRLMDLEGGSDTVLVADGSSNWNADWSPDGGRIVYQSDRNGGFDLYTMDADGGNTVRITEGPAPWENLEPNWGPAPDPAAADTGSFRKEPRLLVTRPSGADCLIRFALSEDAPTSLAILDVAGRSLRVLVRGRLGPGEYQTVWDGRSEGGREMADGVYLCRLVSGGAGRTEKIVRLR